MQICDSVTFRGIMTNLDHIGTPGFEFIEINHREEFSYPIAVSKKEVSDRYKTTRGVALFVLDFLKNHMALCSSHLLTIRKIKKNLVAHHKSIKEPFRNLIEKILKISGQQEAFDQIEAAKKKVEQELLEKKEETTRIIATLEKEVQRLQNIKLSLDNEIEKSFDTVILCQDDQKVFAHLHVLAYQSLEDKTVKMGLFHRYDLTPMHEKTRPEDERYPMLQHEFKFLNYSAELIQILINFAIREKIQIQEFTQLFSLYELAEFTEYLVLKDMLLPSLTETLDIGEMFYILLCDSLPSSDPLIETVCSRIQIENLDDVTNAHEISMAFLNQIIEFNKKNLDQNPELIKTVLTCIKNKAEMLDVPPQSLLYEGASNKRILDYLPIEKLSKTDFEEYFLKNDMLRQADENHWLKFFGFERQSSSIKKDMEIDVQQTKCFSVTGNLLCGTYERPDILTLIVTTEKYTEKKATFIESMNCAMNALDKRPLVSTLSGCIRSLLGLIHTIAHLALSIFHAKFRHEHIEEARIGAINFGRGLLAAIPILGNGALFLIDRKREKDYERLAISQLNEEFNDSAALFGLGKLIGRKPLTEYNKLITHHKPIAKSTLIQFFKA